MIAVPKTEATRPERAPIRDALSWFTAERVCLGILGILTAFTCWQVLGNGTSIGQDAATQFYPWYSYLGERLREFGIPSWNPAQFSGAPFAADPQSGWSYWPAMAIFAIVPLSVAIPVFVAFHLILAGFGAYALARALQVAPVGALVAGVSYELFGPIFSRSVCCPAQVQVGAWVPILLIGVEVALQKPTFRERFPWVALSAVAMSQIVASWLGQGSYYALMLVGGFLLYRALLDPPVSGRMWKQRIIDFVSIFSLFGALSLGLAAIGIFPRLEYNRLSNLAGGIYDGADQTAAVTGGWKAGHTVFEQVTRDAYYPGGVTIALATTALLLARGRKATPFFTLTVIVGFVLSSNQQTPLHRLLFLALPRFEDLHQHWPQRIALAVFIAVALLAGAAVSSIPDWFGKRKELLGIAAIPVAIAAAFTVGLRSSGDRLPYVVVISVLVVAGSLVVAGTRRAAMLWPFLPVVLIVAMSVDLILANREMLAHGDYGGYHKVDIDTYYAEPEAARFIREVTEAGEGRFFGFDTWLRYDETARPALYRFQFPSERTKDLIVNNRATIYGIEDVQGYNPVQLQAYVDFMHNINEEVQEYHDANIYPPGLDSRLLDLLNARYVVIPAEIPVGRPDLQRAADLFPTVYQDDSVRVLERPSAMPRAWIVHEARTALPEVARQLVASGEVNPAEVALVDRELDLRESTGSYENDMATVEVSEPEEIIVATRTDAPGLLVLSEVAYPAWEAYVDGEPQEIATAFGLLRAVEIPAGEHIVELRFESQNEVWGIGVTLVTIGLIVTGLFWTWSHRVSVRFQSALGRS